MKKELSKEIKYEIKKAVNEKRTRKIRTIFWFLTIIFSAISFFLAQTAVEDWDKTKEFMNVFTISFLFSLSLPLIFSLIWIIYRKAVRRIPKVFICEVSETKPNFLQDKVKKIIIKNYYFNKVYTLSFEEYDTELDRYARNPENKIHLSIYRPGRMDFSVSDGRNSYIVLCDVHLVDVPSIYLLKFLENRNLKFKADIREIISYFFYRRLENSKSPENFLENLEELLTYLEDHLERWNKLSLKTDKRGSASVSFFIKPIKVTNAAGTTIWSETRKRIVSPAIFRKPKSTAEKIMKREEMKINKNNFLK